MSEICNQNLNPAPFYNEPDFTLYHGDCLNVLAALPEESVDLIFADPPYFLGKAAWDESQGAETDLDFHRQWLTACRRVLKPDGSLWVSGMRRSIYQCHELLEELGFAVLDSVVWWKPNLKSTHSHRRLLSSHEILLRAAKSPEARPFFNSEILRQWRKNHCQRAVCPHCGSGLSVDVAHRTGEAMSNVWAIATTYREEKSFGYHPTQKPYDLLLRIIYASSRTGDTVLDPFCGTGTTGIAAHKNDRRFIGIDFTPEYLDIAVKRFEHLRQQMTANNRKEE